MADRVSPMTATQQGCAVITGIAGTIGLALAKAYLRRGVDVVGVDVDPQALEAAQEQLKPYGGRVLAVPLDVGDPDQVADLATEVESSFGAPTVLCANAGVIGPLGSCGNSNRQTSNGCFASMFMEP